MDTFRSAKDVDAFGADRLALARSELGKLVQSGGPHTVETALAPFDRIGAALDAAANAAGLLRSVHPDETVRKAAEEAEQKVSSFATDLSLNRDVYLALAAVDGSAADATTRHFLKRVLRDFRRAGVDKDDATRARIRGLNEELVRIGQEFDSNIRTDVRTVRLRPSQLDGLPEDWKRAHPAGDDGTVAVTTDYPDYVPFMTYAHDGPARKELYVASRNRAVPRNLQVLSQLLSKRHELAGLLGYPSWAAYVTEDKMIGSETNADDFIEKITAASEKRMKADYAVLVARKRHDDPEATQVYDWERAYYEDRVSHDSYQFDGQSVRPYFRYGRVKEGLFTITGRMFGVRYESLTNDAGAWHADVDAYELLDAVSGKKLGRFYLDMHPREGKYKHAAMFPIVTGVAPGKSAGGVLPEAALVCNFPRATASDPALLEHDDVKTFFHEFGHLLHHLFGGHLPWAGVSGIRTEWDFVEAPSQMLEEWVWDAETLSTFARHVKTGEPIPSDTVQRMRAASDFGKGLQVRHQMYYAKLSLELYRRNPAGLDTTALSKELMNRTSAFRFVEETHFEASFGHLDGYSAIYYTYMWSLVIAKDLFGAFRARGLLDPGTAARYRNTVLAPGGSKDAKDLVEEFLGRPVDFGAFEAWLNEG